MQKNDVAVVSTKKTSPQKISSEDDYQMFISRTLKVALNEVGHNLGLTDHARYKKTRDGGLCPMSKGEFNKFGYRGYVRAIIDGRGLSFCNECTYFLKRIYGDRNRTSKMLKDGLEETLFLNTDKKKSLTYH